MGSFMNGFNTTGKPKWEQDVRGTLVDPVDPVGPAEPAESVDPVDLHLLSDDPFHDLQVANDVSNAEVELMAVPERLSRDSRHPGDRHPVGQCRRRSETPC